MSGRTLALGALMINHYPDASRSEMLSSVPLTAHRVLDVGCASGGFGELLKRTRPYVQVDGVEPNPTAAALARQRLTVVHDGLFPNTIPRSVFQGKYDCVVLNDVIEHVTDPEPLLVAAREALRAGGVIVASIPNVRFAPVVYNLALRGRWDYQDQGVLDRTHMRFYTRRSMVQLFKDNGLEILRMRRLNVPGSNRAPRIAKAFETIVRDLSCPQFAIAASPN